MSKHQIYKKIIALHSSCYHKTKKEIVEELKKIAHQTADELQNISEANRKSYTKDIELSRLKRKKNNSRQAIRKNWNRRAEKKDLILKHISILREIR